MQDWNFTSIIHFIEDKVTRQRQTNLRSTGQEYPQYQKSQDVKRNMSGRSAFRETGNTHILLLEDAVYMDMECYQQKRSEHRYQLWSFVPGLKEPCLLLQSSGNRNLLHRHDFMEMVLVFNGVYTTEIEGKICSFHENEICLINSNCEHREIELECDGLFLYLGFRPSDHNGFWKKYLAKGELHRFLLEGIKTSGPGSYLMISLPSESIAEIKQYVGRIFEELLERQLGFEQNALTWLVRLLNFLERIGKEKREQVSEQSASVVLYQKMIDYIHTHLSTVDLEELREVFHYQEDYYNRLFQKMNGQSFQAYLIQQKMLRAKELLQETNITVKEIMEQIGYQSKPYFYDSFRKATGMTPVQYRKQGEKREREIFFGKQ